MIPGHLLASQASASAPLEQSPLRSAFASPVGQGLAPSDTQQLSYQSGGQTRSLSFEAKQAVSALTNGSHANAAHDSQQSVQGVDNPSVSSRGIDSDGDTGMSQSYLGKHRRSTPIATKEKNRPVPSWSLRGKATATHAALMAASSSSFSSTPTPTAADHAANNSNAHGAGGGINGGLSSESAFGGNMLPNPNPFPALDPHIAAHLRDNNLSLWQAALSDQRIACAIVEREVGAHGCANVWQLALTNADLAKRLIWAECEMAAGKAALFSRRPNFLQLLRHLPPLHPLPLPPPLLPLLPLLPQLLMLLQPLLLLQPW